MISSCNNNSASLNVLEDVNYLAVTNSTYEDFFKDKSEYRFSCVDSKGNIKYEDWFKVNGDGDEPENPFKIKVDGDYLGIPSNFVNGYFTLGYRRHYYLEHHHPLFKASKQPKIVKGCEDLYSVGCMNDGVIPVTKQGERISVIDGTGKTLFTLDPIDGKEIISCDIAFYDGLLRIKNEEGKYGFVDKKGNVVISPQYYTAFPFSEGKALVMVNVEGWIEKRCWAKYSVIDTRGNVISNWEGTITTNDLSGRILKYEEIEENRGKFHDGMLLVENSNGRFLFIDAKGNTKYLTPAEVVSVAEYNSKCFVCYFNRNWGVMDFNDKIIIPAQYDGIAILKNGNFLCREYHSNKIKIHLYDSSGREKNKIECDYLRVYGNFIIATNHTSQNNRTIYKDILLDNELKPIAEFTDTFTGLLLDLDVNEEKQVTTNYIKSQNR
jgi:hypothetical protein